jgi:hypothetical protein
VVQAYAVVVTVLVTVAHPVVAPLELTDGFVVMKADKLFELLNTCEDPAFADNVYSDSP